MIAKSIIFTKKALSLKEMNSMGRMLPPMKVNQVGSLRGTYSREEFKVQALALAGEIAQRIKGIAVLVIDEVVARQ